MSNPADGMRDYVDEIVDDSAANSPEDTDGDK
jgi:hypothetical protein